MAENLSCIFSNLSSDFITSSLWSLEEDSTDTNRFLMTIIYLIFLVIGFPWNAAVIISIFRKHLYREPTMMLILNLTVSNLLICALIFPFTIITGIAGEFVYGASDRVRCQICQLGVIYLVLTFVSLNTLALISVDRFLYIKKPLHYNMMVTIKKTIVAVLLLWMFSILVSIPPLFGFGTIRFSKLTLMCTIAFRGNTFLAKNTFYLIFLILASLPPVTTLAVTNIWMLHIAQKAIRINYKKIRRGASTTMICEKIEKEYNKKQLNLMRVFFAIFITNIITWLPVIVIFIARAAYEPTPTTSLNVRIYLISIPFLLLLSQAVVHPILQVILIKKIKEQVLAPLYACQRRCCSKYDNSPTEGLVCGCKICSGTHECIFLDLCKASLIASTQEETTTSTI